MFILVDILADKAIEKTLRVIVSQLKRRQIQQSHFRTYVIGIQQLARKQPVTRIQTAVPERNTSVIALNLISLFFIFYVR